ncbi:MAG: LysM peptidoglycan-binding domain-containing protein [Bacteroidota bacterium]
MRPDLKIIAFFLLLMMPVGLKSQTTKDQLKQIRSSVIETFDGREYYIHTIKRGQTLYMISKAYGVEVNDLIRENPQVKEGIKADHKIRIPKSVKKPVEGRPTKPPSAIEKPATGKQDSVINQKTSFVPDSIVREELPCGKDNTTKKDVYQVALMMPLFLNEADKLNAENPDPEIFETSKCLQFLPFYEGFRMALDSLEKSGLKIKLWVYDVDKDTAKTRLLLQKPELKSMDLIFGLLYHRNFQMVAVFAEENKINIVNPLSERSELVVGNPFVFKVRPSKKALPGQLAEYMAPAFYRGQVLIVRGGQYADRDAPERLKKECQERKLDAQIVEGQEAVIGRLSKEKENYLIFFTENPEYILDLTRRLFELRNEYNITLVGLPDWLAMDGLETEYMVALKTHVVSSNMIDYNNLFVKKFVQQYQAIYKSDPPLLAFQGFDLSYYFLSALQIFGANIQRCLGEFRINTLQTNFDFRNAKGSGFENQNWMIYKYENYRLEKVN